MNYNILAYFIYGLVTLFTIVYVGKILHQNGRYYVLRIFAQEEIGDFINNTLLVAYYLFNIGYVFLTISNWERIHSGVQLVEILGNKTGVILLLLGCLHFFNILALKLYAAYNNINLGAIEKKSPSS